MLAPVAIPQAASDPIDDCSIHCWCCEECLGLRRDKSKRKSSKIYPPEDNSETVVIPISTSGPTQTKHLTKLVISQSLDDRLLLHLDCKVSGEVKDMCVQCASKRINHNPSSAMGTSDEYADYFPVNWMGQVAMVPDQLPQADLPRENGIVPIDTEDAEAHRLFVDAFLHNNRLEHMVQVMGYHPRYLHHFLKTQQFLLRGDGPLPYDYRHYIAIMAAARHQCSYLVNIQTTEFLLQGGDERWLKGLEYAPKKLRSLCEINKLLAHRPWLVNQAHIERLVRGQGGQDAWSLSELMHVLVLLAHFHALSSFVYGCGISAEVDQEDGHTYSPNSPSLSPRSKVPTSPCKAKLSTSHPGSGSPNCSPSSASEVEGGIEALMERMRRLTEVQEEMSQEEMQKRFERIETIELPVNSSKPSPDADILRFIDDADFTYQDFAKRGAPTEIPTFRAQDYSWEDHGFSLANRLYAEIGNLLDDKFQETSGLTYFTMGDNEDVDTSSFRRSIWNYIHCMFGIRHDDYDYSEVNQLLERSLKAYIKTVTCYPERITRKDYEAFMKEFKHSEKVHVNLMLLEARLQAELLYSLRAIMRYMT